MLKSRLNKNTFFASSDRKLGTDRPFLHSPVSLFPWESALFASLHLRRSRLELSLGHFPGHEFGSGNA